MTYEATAQITPMRKRVDAFCQLSTDDKLAVLWELYLTIRNESSLEDPERNDNNAPDSPNDLFNQVKGMSADDQLALMRNILDGEQSGAAGDYRSLTNTTRIAFWYELAQGMNSADIVQVPDEYQISSEGQQLLKELRDTGFEQQFIFIRNALLGEDGQPSV